MQLNQHEARVIGCLLEKEITTPDQYPLSLNSLTLACNQKSSRDPVLELSETDVQNAIDSLNKKRLISEQSGFGSRVIKYKHRFCNTEFSELLLSPAGVAIVCLLLLRGPQTAGELRTRSNRLHDFKDLHEVEHELDKLASREPALVQQLAREPGRRECRFMSLFTPTAVDIHQSVASNITTHITQADDDNTLILLSARVDQLEEQVRDLTEKLALLIGE